jgi:hypothetical protein
MRRALLPALAASMVAGALGFAAPLVGRASLQARGFSAAEQGRALKLSAAPSLRLSGGATGLQAGVFDGIKATDIDGKEVDLGKYSSVPAVLVVNLASA